MTFIEIPDTTRCHLQDLSMIHTDWKCLFVNVGVWVENDGLLGFGELPK